MNYERRYSEIAAWLKCPRQHYYAWQLGLEPARPNFKMIYGLLFHKGMEAYWKGRLIELEVVNYAKELQAKYSDSLIDEDLELIHKQAIVALENVNKAIKEFKCEEYECIGAEVEIKIEVVIPTIIVGHIDAVLKHKETNELWIVDYKTRAKFKDNEEELYNMQLALYTKIWEAKGLGNVAGTMVWQASNKQEESPRMLKSGAMSREKINCTWDKYKKALLDNSLNPLDYFDMERKLDSKSEFSCIVNRKDKIIVDNIFEEIISALLLMRHNNIKHRNLIPNNCNFCDYKKICYAELSGTDTDLILKNYYTRRDLKNVHHKEEA